MRFIRLAVVSFVIFFVLLTVIGLLFPPVVTVVRRGVIQAPKEKIYPFIADTKNWHKWLADSTVVFAQLTPATTGKGAAVSIGGKRVQIIAVTHDYVEAEWELNKKENRIQTSGFYLLPDKETSGTVVQLHFTQKLKWYPWERIAARLNERVLGPVLDNNILQLDEAVKAAN